MPYRCQASGFRPYAVEGRSMVAVTHLALLGVKIQDSAFWGNTKDEKQPFYTAAFACVYFGNSTAIQKYNIIDIIWNKDIGTMMEYNAKLLTKLALIFFGLLFLVCVWLGRRVRIKEMPEGDKITLEDVQILLEALDLYVVDKAGARGDEASVVEGTSEEAKNLTYAEYMDIYRQVDGETLGLPDYGERYEPEYEMLRADWYEAYRIMLAHLDTESSVWETTVFLLRTEPDKKTAYTENSTNQTPYNYCSQEFAHNTLREMRVYVKGSELLTVIEVLSGEHELHNVWVMESTDGMLQCFYHQVVFQTEAEHPVERERIADLTFRDGRAVETQEKTEKIHGKLLWVSEEELEIEGQGVYPIAEGMEVYKLYADLETLSDRDLKIGYEDTDYVIDKGQICACLVSQAEKADRIRVLLKNSAKNSNYFDMVELSVDGETIRIETDDLEVGERRTYHSSALTDKITVHAEGMNKQDNAYRGAIECYRHGNGIVLINELPLEEYLYAVVPSEMPASYPLESLKAQAVCARTYAYSYILRAGLPEMGAHVDDTTAYQVYHNSSENAASTTAVKETDGILLTYKGQPAQNYYYSTSCGVGTDTAVWKAGSPEDTPYIRSVRMNQDAYMDKKDTVSFGNDEDAFRDFITSVDETDLEKDEPWYRWEYNVEKADAEEMLSRIQSRYESSPESVLTRTEGGYYVSQPIEKLGRIHGMEIVKRGAGGVADELLIEAQTGTYKILAEYNIRSVLCDKKSEVIRQDGSVVIPTSLLPSGFFIIECSKSGENMVGYTLVGGGYGHGVGMSQNGARALGTKGASFQDILQFYFKGCQVEKIEGNG